MCVVSNVTDHYGQWPINPFQPPVPPQPVTIKPLDWTQAAPVSLPWDRETVKMLEEILERLKKLDAALGLPDCEDPKKQEWLKRVKKAVKKRKKKGQ